MLKLGSAVLILSCLGLFLPTNCLPVDENDQDEPISSIASAAMAVVSAGSSVMGTTMSALMADGYYVMCGIEIENWTKYVLDRPIAHVKGGALSSPPVIILPAKKEVMMSHKTGWTATGVYGTASWLIKSTVASQQRRLVVMWSAPFDFNIFSNTLAVGITKPGYTSHPAGHTWFDEMYYDETIKELNYIKKEFYRDFHPIEFEDDDYEVVATMGSSHKAEVRIHIRPKKFEDLAANIKNQIHKK